jgi:hypothetical protein
MFEAYQKQFQIQDLRLQIKSPESEKISAGAESGPKSAINNLQSTIAPSDASILHDHQTMPQVTVGNRIILGWIVPQFRSNSRQPYSTPGASHSLG